MTTVTPRIYVASLADYNAGRLHGRWIDADQPAEDIYDEVQEMLAESKEPIAEEWAIHDYDGFGPLNLSEYESFEKVSDYATAISEHGEAFAAWVEQQGNDSVEDFQEAYIGTGWNSLEDYAAELIEEIYDTKSMGNLAYYIDYEKFARDLEIGDGYWTFTDSDYQLHIFRPV